MNTKLAELINGIEEKLVKAKEVYGNKKIRIADADGPMESAGISLSRWILEDEINLSLREVNRLEKLLQALKFIAKNNKSTGKVRVGSIVEIYFDGKKKELIITEKSEDFSLGILSINSQLGEIIRGKSVGYEGEYETESGKHKIRIEKIS